MNQDEVQRFHDGLGRAYLAYAYADHPAVYPTGLRRTQAVAALVAERLRTMPTSVVDLGCGRADLCLRLAAMGCNVTGVDFSRTMLDEADGARRLVPQEVAARVTLVHADAFESGLAEGAYDVVTAVGVLETEEEDGRLLREAHRLLRAGGTLVVTTRNRLFNMVSLNRHTHREVESGHAALLLAEIETLLGRSDPHAFVAACRQFAAAMRTEAEAAASPHDTAVPARCAPSPVRIAWTRQHTPLGLEAVAAAHGFVDAKHVGLHPHAMPPALEPLAPEWFNAVSRACDAFAHLPVALVWSSAVVTALTKA
jgi:SAM-dependent methyltransferase